MEVIRINYLYRDCSNYKSHSSVLFSNPNNLPLEEIDTEIRKYLLDETWFLHSQWNIPDLHFEKTDWEQDHPYHEYGGLEIMEINKELANAPIEELLQRVRKII
jgi:hypothetical protein